MLTQDNRLFAEFYAEFIQIFNNRDYSNNRLFLQLQ